MTTVAASDPTDIEQQYIARGYTLPTGVTWSIVHEKRREYGFSEDVVPLANVEGVACGWGTPLWRAHK